MKTTQNRKKIQIQPIKSPSPDVANRNFIKDTIAPVQQIQKYNHSRSQSRSPRISKSIILNTGSSQVDKLKNQLLTLRQQLRFMKDYEAQNHNLHQRNNMLIQQITYLKNQLDRLKRSYPETNKGTDSLNYNNYYQNDKTTRQLNQRLIKISQQNKRLEKKIQDSYERLQFINKQNEMLKNQINFYKKQTSRPNTQYGYTNIFRQQIQQSYRLLQTNAQQRQLEFENHIQYKLKQIQLRIDKIKMLQNILEERIEKQKIQIARNNNNLSSPPKQDYSMSRTWRSKKPYQSHPLQNLSQDYDSPMKLMKIRESQQKLKSQNIRLTDKITLLNRQIDHLRQELSDRDRHINSLQLKIKQLNQKIERQNLSFKDQTDKKKIYPIEMNILNESQLTFLKQKVSYLQSDLKNKSSTISNLQQQIELKQKDCSLVKKRLDQANNFLKNQMPNFQKILQQQRIKNQRLQDQNNILTNKIIDIQNQKVNELSQMKQQLSRLPKLLNNIKCLQEQRQKKTNLLSNVLKQYLKLIQDIKLTLSSQKMQRVVFDTNSLEQNLINIQKMKVQSNNLIAQLKKKLLNKQQKIAELEKNNGILISQIQHLKNQQLKLKQLIQSYISQKSESNIELSIKNTKASKISNSLKQCLDEALTQINQLQLQVNSHLLQLNQTLEH